MLGDRARIVCTLRDKHEDPLLASHNPMRVFQGSNTHLSAPHFYPATCPHQHLTQTHPPFRLSVPEPQPLSWATPPHVVPELLSPPSPLVVLQPLSPTEALYNRYLVSVPASEAPWLPVLKSIPISLSIARWKNQPPSVSHSVPQQLSTPDSQSLCISLVSSARCPSLDDICPDDQLQPGPGPNNS